ncbi:hypothetical protein DA83_16080 [Pseudomonas sp. 250J]|nr:hypothetical protein DA83_16080 [Pseudomonas sp. 250J]
MRLPDPKRKGRKDLIKLGDMIGDGLADEPDGAWIRRDYKRVAKALGHGMPRRNNSAAINAAVARFLEGNKCPCGGPLKQTRSGALRVMCGSCCRTIQLKATKAGTGQ